MESSSHSKKEKKNLYHYVNIRLIQISVSGEDFLFVGLRYINWNFSDWRSQKKTWTPFIVIFYIVHRNWVKFQNNYFLDFCWHQKQTISWWCREKSFLFLTSQFFRSTGNVIQQIKSSLTSVWSVRSQSINFEAMILCFPKYLAEVIFYDQCPLLLQ